LRVLDIRINHFFCFSNFHQCFPLHEYLIIYIFWLLQNFPIILTAAKSSKNANHQRWNCFP
jgi:hypothetical protein